MKKLAVVAIVLLCTSFEAVAFAGDWGENMVGSLFLFQKCDTSLVPEIEVENPQYDANGCPLPGAGPWPVFLENRRWGHMKYNLFGDKFRFSFQGRRLLPETDYTLIYYPDGWPGKGLLCLGGSMSNADGNVQIRGRKEISTGLPAPYDANFNPVAPSGASGAKIWLVPSADVKCEGEGDLDPETGLPAEPSQLLAWNPASYLFEANLIVYEYSESQNLGDADQDDEDDLDGDAGVTQKRGGKSKNSSSPVSVFSGKNKKKE